MHYAWAGDDGKGDVCAGEVNHVTRRVKDRRTKEGGVLEWVQGGAGGEGEQEGGSRMGGKRGGSRRGSRSGAVVVSGT